MTAVQPAHWEAYFRKTLCFSEWHAGQVVLRNASLGHTLVVTCPLVSSVPTSLEVERVGAAGVGENFAGIHDPVRVQSGFDPAHEGNGIRTEVELQELLFK